MTAVIFATAREAAPFLTLAGQPPCEKGSRPAILGRQDRSGVVTLISGMGPEAARAATLTAIEECGARRLVNAGICGALHSGSRWEPGAVFAVERARTIEDQASAPSRVIDCDRSGWAHLPVADLVTRARPLFDGALRTKLSRWGALVDMEGAAIAALAHDRGLPCTLIKGITDLATEGGRDDLHRRLDSVSSRIAEVLAAGLMPTEPK